MESAARRSGGGVLEGFYRLVMRRTPVYVTFVIAGALLGERAVDYGVKTLWEKNNVGKRYEDISVLGQRPVDE
ncbi:cytochrome b-c1 complex subunit 9 [Solanum lycopersicum]|uniref:Cytochrome b-c1 complex subunit 9 n=6 Tax=Solanum TaxID=4107 RepID=QCR9_SOLTU|nr:cytochrome b-c1 complex subunit 9 [Solanum lycopersicum]XP_015056717.1 cytochrome b-c1 complex subunit 9 [Solanum pennellii]XP_049353805.1 cytochrome b-c1 complex subunit 9 [Solanum verrucosum]XP_049379347.1 cytochrome b-c1 complex subunit 9 [Solanum stenotomum]P46270.1 RecName: Full=Cytochrome b-c1 complex subunit 9; AltName: Full=Complex III subunit 9; AltName: Full=Complex III subunit X; AltName: Full=Ubiquinol-cytochrome c reductase complex 8.0 kDa protein [Solanum tuberosum]TMW84282.1 